MPVLPDGTQLPYPGDDGGDIPGDTIELLRTALTALQAALVQEPDDVDSQALAQVVQGLYRILASRQKEQESALGMTPALKLMARG